MNAIYACYDCKVIFESEGSIREWTDPEFGEVFKYVATCPLCNQTECEEYRQKGGCGCGSGGCGSHETEETEHEHAQGGCGSGCGCETESNEVEHEHANNGGGCGGGCGCHD